MNILNEKQLLSTIHLSDIQKVILAKIVAAATDQVALEEISKGRNLVANRNILSKLGLINVTNNQASLTDNGIQIMKKENIIGDDNTLTDEGSKYAEVNDVYDLKDIDQENEPEEPENEPPTSFESLTLIKDINQLMLENQLLNSINK